ncbi:MAG: hypothetical protein AWM53_00028 [Candidatus Dichloromethanomonas elyunquensis]|nr:MAG: hypothetical protein AWM53_00028 [Candidatus Dichloromethanomonas elyunquensis]
MGMSGKSSVKQFNNFYFTYFSLWYVGFYFTTGYFWLFYKLILLSNEQSKGIYQAA